MQEYADTHSCVRTALKDMLTVISITESVFDVNPDSEEEEVFVKNPPWRSG